MPSRILVFCALLVAFLAVPFVLSAQEEGEMSVTGCFNKAEREGYYVLTKKDSGEKIMVTGSAALEPHSSNHEVTVTGTMEGAGDDAVLMATAIQHIAGTCTAPEQ